MSPRGPDDKDYVTVTHHATSGKFNVSIMRYRQAEDGYVAERTSVALTRTAANALARSWAFIEELEVR